ncbi:MAG: prolyl oligopeptidase family serine peptidase [Verrucomicrobiota bacterium]
MQLKCIVLCGLCAMTCCAEEWKLIERKIPPAGMGIPGASRERLEAEWAGLQQEMRARGFERDADLQVYLKAVAWALKHDEFYRKGDESLAEQLLARAKQRLSTAKEAPWKKAKGLVVRGYHSRIDGSVQPYGLEIPEQLKLDRAVPLYVWLHGRGDKNTDLYFIRDRESRPGRIQVDDAIVVHPFGRHCMGFKSAGEIDVLDVIEEVKRNYPIDPRRVVLMGFSMGGAGAWHIGAHYTDRFAAIHAGAGFAETARYNRLQPEKYPPRYEQTLWRMYDVPNYVRNLFNRPVVAYSGEVDKQIQAARVMEEAFKAEGRVLPHIIGPKMPHKYDPGSLAEVLLRMRAALEHAEEDRDRVFLQTQTLRYNRLDWVELLRLKEHWQDTRVDAQFREGHVVVKTKNVRAFRIHRPARSIRIDGQAMAVGKDAAFWLREGRWSTKSVEEADRVKKPGLQGPIDDAFLSPFLVVTPSGTPEKAETARWVDFELQHFLARWEALYRGKARVKRDVDVTEADVQKYHLVAWGDHGSNAVLGKLRGRLPLEALADHQVPLFVYPNPLNPEKYLVVNSGPTHREGHDRTNSLQNPKLPDWAILDVRQAPDALGPGKVVDAGFFDEAWQF